MFQELDKNADGRLDATEMRAALSRSGIDITPSTADDLVRFLASGASDSGSGSSKSTQSAGPSEKDMYITFAEFRDFLIMLPRKATPFEIYKCEWANLSDSVQCQGTACYMLPRDTQIASD